MTSLQKMVNSWNDQLLKYFLKRFSFTRASPQPFHYRFLRSVESDVSIACVSRKKPSPSGMHSLIYVKG